MQHWKSSILLPLFLSYSSHYLYLLWLRTTDVVVAVVIVVFLCMQYIFAFFVLFPIFYTMPLYSNFIDDECSFYIEVKEQLKY